MELTAANAGAFWQLVADDTTLRVLNVVVHAASEYRTICIAKLVHVAVT